MSRIVNAGNATALAGSALVACVMVKLDFASGMIYLNDGISEVLYGGNVYSPVGIYGGIDSVDETLDATARPVRLMLSGVDASIVATAQNEIYKNRSATIYLAAMDPIAGTLVEVPETVWEGRMNKMTITKDAGLGSLALTCESRMRREPRIARYTDSDQQQQHAGDIFLSFQEQLIGFVAQWGNQNMLYGGPNYGNFAPNSPNWLKQFHF